jgi:hypothetical protein
MAWLAVLVAIAALAEDEGAELHALQAKVPTFKVREIAMRAGDVALAADDALTIDKLRGVELDDHPPIVGEPAKPYDPGQVDGLPPGTAPYVAPGIKPFRLRQFTAEFNYGGWHNFKMIEYAATHGFGVIYPYVMNDRSHMPRGTQWLQWGSFVDWAKFFAAHNVPWGRFDKLADVDVVKDLTDSGVVWKHAPDTIAMLDLEHEGAMAPENLRKQDWYPKDADEAARQAFEAKYYRGYARTFTALVEALHRAGWTRVGCYPQPYGSGWYALLGLAEKGLGGLPDPLTYWPWVTYGKQMYEAQDVLYPDVYVYYWSRQNVAYTLARIDFDRTLIRTMAVRKPMRPYYWPLLHGGDASYHWWNQLPLPTEDERAIFALAMFAGCDGAVLWNWSEFDNHHVPPALWKKTQTTAVGEIKTEGGTGADVQVKSDFEVRPEGAGEDVAPTKIKRYDVLAITEVNEQTGMVRFQHIDTTKQLWGERLDPKKPYYVMKKEDLVPHLRAPSEPVSGAVEGLALVKPIEGMLKRGEVKVDVAALDVYVKTLPIVRRVKVGKYHLIATFDPMCVQGGAPREIVLKDFDGHRGMTLRLPADRETRVFAIREK